MHHCNNIYIYILWYWYAGYAARRCALKRIAACMSQQLKHEKSDKPGTELKPAIALTKSRALVVAMAGFSSVPRNFGISREAFCRKENFSCSFADFLRLILKWSGAFGPDSPRLDPHVQPRWAPNVDFWLCFRGGSQGPPGKLCLRCDPTNKTSMLLLLTKPLCYGTITLVRNTSRVNERVFQVPVTGPLKEIALAEKQDSHCMTTTK